MAKRLGEDCNKQSRCFVHIFNIFFEKIQQKTDNPIMLAQQISENFYEYKIHEYNLYEYKIEEKHKQTSK